MNKKTCCALAIILVAFTGTLWSQDSKKKKHKKQATAAVQDDGGGEAPSNPAASMKGSLEAYLRRRQAKLEKAQKVRADFITKESEIWTNFWNKMFDERNLFEVRIARQRLDQIESLSSLDANDRVAPLTDFEKLQSNMMKSFEEKQRQKMQNFFAQQDSRWKSFAFQQEKDRAEFADEAQASWERQRSALLGEAASSGSRDSAPGAGDSQGSGGEGSSDGSGGGGNADWSVR